MKVTGRTYAAAITGLLARKEHWYEEYLMANISRECWARKQVKYDKKLVKIQSARAERLAQFNS
jgi:hypothetical protein